MTLFKTAPFLSVFTLLAVGSCGYSDAELQAAYKEGHRAGIIWCKRDQPREDPAIDAELLARWRSGFSDAASIQCVGKVQDP